MASLSEALNLTFDFGMAGLGVRVTCPPMWLEVIARSWASWEPSPDTVPWPVDIRLTPELTPPGGPLFEAVPQCRAGTCVLKYPGFEGFISTDEAYAELSLHPDARAADIGYFLRVALTCQAFARDGLIFHTAAILHHGRGYAFFGTSGSGKTTAARLSAPDPVLNDDLVVLWPGDAGWTMVATPFGKRRSDVRRAPLSALLRLVQSPQVSLDRLPPGRALAELVANSPVISGDPEWLPTLMERWEAVLREVPVYALQFRREASFWEAIDAEFG
jgi:hypothetical protein